MARGRMINNKISSNKQVNDLSDDTCRLLYTWMIPHADREGRMRGDPVVVRNTVFARRTDISTEQVERYLQEMVDVGLIIWYEAGGDKFVWFPGFEDNQPGLRRDREAASDFPPPSDDDIEQYTRRFTGSLPSNCRSSSGLSPEEVRSNSGVSPEEVRLKLNLNLREVKVNSSGGVNAREENFENSTEKLAEEITESPVEKQNNGHRPNVYRAYEREIGPLTPVIADKLTAAEDEYPPGWIEMAISEAASQNVRKWSYISAILERWRVNGLQPIRGSPKSGNNRSSKKSGLDDWARGKSPPGETP